MSNDPGLVFDGHTVVDGKSYRVTLNIDNIELIHSLGRKAARTKGKRVTAMYGAIKVKVMEVSYDQVTRKITAA